MHNSSPGLLFHLFWQHRWRMLFAAIAGVFLAGLYVLFADRMYSASVIAVPAKHEEALRGGLGFGLDDALGGLGALAGLGNNDEQVRESLAVLRSRSLIEKFIQENGIMPELFEEQWDEDAGQWRDEANAPTLWDAYEKFTESVFSVTEDTRDGLIIVEIVWTDPALAASWANSIVRYANDRIRNRAIAEGTNSIEYLQNELEKTSLAEIRRAIFSLILTQIQKVMLANTRPDYAFEIIDPAQPKDQDAYDYPRPMILVPAGAIAVLAIYALALFVGVAFSSDRRNFQQAPEEEN